MEMKERERQIRKYVDRMPSLSTTVTKVLEVCNSPNTSANDLNRVISLDPVLTGRVLKLINSAYYSLPNRIASLTMAIVMLGLNTVKNLALSTAVLDLFGGKGPTQVLPTDDFWMHSICTGVTAKLLAGLKNVSRVELEEYFVAGLLHDIGKLPLSYRFPQEYAETLKMAQKEQLSLDQVEDRVFGMDHCMVGNMIAKKWQLGKTMSESILFHHSPDNGDEENRQLVSIVALANISANSYGMGSSGDICPDTSRMHHLLEELGISDHSLSDLQDTVHEEIEKAKIFLEVAQQG